jgi:hypothetical protein
MCLVANELEELCSPQRWGAKAVHGVLHRLLQQECIIFAGLQLVQDVLIMFLPSL